MCTQARVLILIGSICALWHHPPVSLSLSLTHYLPILLLLFLTQTHIQSFDSSVVVCSVLTWILFYILFHRFELLIQTRVYKLFCSSYNLFIIKIRSRAVCARIAYSFHACFLPFNHSLCLFVNKLVCVCVFSVLLFMLAFDQ